ncbi:hypothetical protein, partial [Barnesiella intestinihominis]|uniref:hypothetical protein n=1 Tax=Barnesiella intestinihominis TaxID=487174 RepID=UPI003AAB43D2
KSIFLSNYKNTLSNNECTPRFHTSGKLYRKALIFHTKITFLYTTYTTNKKAVDTAFHIDGF